MSKVYNKSDDINPLYCNILEEIRDMGNLKGKRKELPFLTFTLTDLDKNILFFPFCQRNWPWILREASDRIMGIPNPGLAFRYSKNWENRREDGGLFSYHYSDRLNGQMKEMLSKKLHSRDKIVLVWNKSDYNTDSRQPCTIILQPFMEHDNKMSMVVFMRNNDAVNILPSDIFIHSTYLKYWCSKYNIQYKNIYWVAAIAYYQKKRDKTKFVSRLLDNWKINYSNLTPTLWTPQLANDMATKEGLEKSLREGGDIKEMEESESFIHLHDYIKEWIKIMALAEAKKRKDKDSFQRLKASVWETEFSIIKDSILI